MQEEIDDIAHRPNKTPDVSERPLMAMQLAHRARRRNFDQLVLDQVDLGADITKDIFEFPGGHRFHFRAPGGGEFAIWSDK